MTICACGCGGQTLKPAARFLRGHNAGHGYHGQGKPRSLTFVSWSQMRWRCTNPQHHAWARYGGRGIQVCAAWSDFAQFLSDMGPRPSAQHSIDRIDNDGPYAPENCRWATKSEQRVNVGPPSSAQLAGLVKARAARAAKRIPTTRKLTA